MAITVNDVEYSWGSITLKINGVELIGYKAISYADGIEREAVYGARRHKIGMTRGKITTEQGSVTMYLKQHRELLDTLGDGWGDVRFDAEVRYAEPGMPTRVDIVEGCKFAGNPEGGEEGASALEREVKFDFMRISRDGKYLAPANQ